MNLPVVVSREEYVPPEDVVFDQVWDPSCVRTVSKRATVPNPDDLVQEFAGAVSHDKVRGTTPLCGVFLHGGGDMYCHTAFPVARTTDLVPQYDSVPLLLAFGKELFSCVHYLALVWSR